MGGQKFLSGRALRSPWQALGRREYLEFLDKIEGMWCVAWAVNAWLSSV
ncbi:MAG: hypothetical protein JKX92_06200 [Porticoccaceae bacterium]|nr:hypothetical protein [Porticoccaceae bacterium]